MPRTIPEIRERLHELADLHGIDELAELAEETRRRAGRRPAPVKSRSLSEREKERIRAYTLAHPTLHYQEIADHFAINPGRVSEIVIGKRGE